ncbi:MAG: glycerophosphodiester phosphodiesterase [Anaerolineae bacterium]|nr:glycerophosphodiester phosphodiesterase [Anaerolineae bacterium]
MNKPRFSFKKILLSLLALILVYHLASLVINKPLHAKVQNIAHRGGAAYNPENSLAAFEQSSQDKVDWLEFDVQLSRDGIPVVYHDENVAELDGGHVSDYSLEQLQSADLGEGQTIPTFEDVLLLAKRYGMRIMPEAKSPELNPGLEEKMLAVIKEHGYQEFTIVQSFSAETLEKIHQLDPDLALCSLYGLGNLSFTLKPPYPGDAKYLCVLSELLILQPGKVRQAHAAGREVYIYPGVFKQPWAIRWAVALGVDGVILDDYRMMDE